MDSQENDLIVPVVNEELHADAVRYKRVASVSQSVSKATTILEQELRKGRVEVKRVKTDRVVDGPQPVQRVGSSGGCGWYQRCCTLKSNGW